MKKKKNFERPPVLGLCRFVGFFSRCSEWVEVCLLLTAVASRVTEHRLQGTRAQ